MCILLMQGPQIFWQNQMQGCRRSIYLGNKKYMTNAEHCYIKCPFLGLGASFGQFSSNGISFHHELIFAMGLEF